MPSSDGVEVFIGAAGGAAHLPGVLASLTRQAGAWRSDEGLGHRVVWMRLLAIAQMPGGVPVGTLAIGKAGAKNAAILAAQILGVREPAMAQAVQRFPQGEQSERDTSLPDA